MLREYTGTLQLGSETEEQNALVFLPSLASHVPKSSVIAAVSALFFASLISAYRRVS